jgi:Tol biopolymer transport system component
MNRMGGVQAAVAANGSLLYVSGGGGAQRKLVSVDRQGRASPLPGLQPDIYRHVRVSPDGRRLALSAAGDVWIYDFARATRSRLTTESGQDSQPFWTRDGQRVIFTSWRSGSPEVFWRSADGTGNDERLFARRNDLTNLFVSSISADGTHLVFTEVPQDLLASIGHVALERPSDGRVLVKGAFATARAAVSPNGRWIAYESNSSGRYEIYIERYPDLGNRQQISATGGRDPRWSSDGSELFFATEDGRQIYAVAVKSGTTLEAGRPQPLFDAGMVPVVVGDQPYDVALDGRFLIMRNEGDDAGSSSTQPMLVLVQNWFEELKRLVPAR